MLSSRVTEGVLMMALSEKQLLWVDNLRRYYNGICFFGDGVTFLDVSLITHRLVWMLKRGSTSQITRGS